MCEWQVESLMKVTEFLREWILDLRALGHGIFGKFCAVKTDGVQRCQPGSTIKRWEGLAEIACICTSAWLWPK
jgi:hypothetical protein